MSNKFILIDPDKEELRDQRNAAVLYVSIFGGSMLIAIGIIGFAAYQVMS